VALEFKFEFDPEGLASYSIATTGCARHAPRVDGRCFRCRAESVAARGYVWLIPRAARAGQQLARAEAIVQDLASAITGRVRQRDESEPTMLVQQRLDAAMRDVSQWVGRLPPWVRRGIQWDVLRDPRIPG
jgi:hypothetical protein